MNAVGGRRAAALTLVLVLSLVLWAPIAGAETVTLEIPIDTVVRAPEGTEHQLASVAVPADLQGLECTVNAVAHNQTSVHPGNDLVVASGDDSLVIEDVEGTSGGDTTAEGTLILSDVVDVTLQMGGDGVFSAGFVVQATCSPPTTTTTTSSTSTTSSSTSTTVPGNSTTTTPTSTSTTMPGSTSTTTTTVPSTTTTAPPSTSSTVPGETTTTTTVLGTSTTTTTPNSTSSTVLGTSTTTIPEDTTSTTVLGTSTSTISPSTVPFTGLAGASSVPLAAGAIAVGTLLVALAGRARESGGERRHLRR